MPLAAFADLAEVIGALGVIAGLIFVGMQLRQNTSQMRRSESNAAMAQASAFRQLLLSNRDAAELIFTGVAGAPLSPLDEFRLNAFFSEIIYLFVNIWDRARNGLIEKDEFERIVPVMTTPITSPRGRAWWARYRASLRPDFVADFEAQVPTLKSELPSAAEPQGAETAVAPPANAG